MLKKVFACQTELGATSCLARGNVAQQWRRTGVLHERESPRESINSMMADM